MRTKNGVKGLGSQGVFEFWLAGAAAAEEFKRLQEWLRGHQGGKLAGALSEIDEVLGFGRLCVNRRPRNGGGL